jgi:3-dehydroquinate synthase class II
MTATILGLGEKILVEVTASEYAEGQYLLNGSDTAELVNAEGEKIKKSDLAVGDTVKIWYTGQVTMSIPPQIIALKIQKQ